MTSFMDDPLIRQLGNLLSLALLEPTEKLVDAAVARRRTAHVELQEACLVRCFRLVAPQQPEFNDRTKIVISLDLNNRVKPL